MSSVASATSLFLASQAQAQARQQTMATVGLKQEAKQGEAIADMLQAAAQASQVASPPPGQGVVVDRQV